MSKSFIDTNVFVYWIDESNQNKKRRSQELIKKLSTDAVCTKQVVREFTNVALNKFTVVADPVSLDDLYDVLFVPILADHHDDIAYLKRATYIKQRYDVSFYDALIIQSAIDLNCDTIYSEDLQHGQVIEGVKVVDPFC